MGKTDKETLGDQLANAALKTVQFEEWLCEHPGGTIEEFVKEGTPRL